MKFKNFMKLEIAKQKIRNKYSKKLDIVLRKFNWLNDDLFII